MVINGITWKLKLRENVGDNLLGVTEFNNPTIAVRYQENKENMSRTLMHEIVHAYLYSYGMSKISELKQMNEEEICEFISHNITNLLKLHKKALKELNDLIIDKEELK